MQMISRDKLLNLLKKPDAIREAEGSFSGSFSYKDFVKMTHKMLAKSREDWPEEDVWMQLENGWVKDHCPPIRYLGMGSSRVALAIDGGKCLKVAMNDEGVEQMQNEIEVLEAGSEYACFPKLYAYDKKKMFSLVTECCCEADHSDFIEAYGLPCILAVGTITQLVEDQLDYDKTEQYFKTCIDNPDAGMNDDFENFEVRLKFLQNLRAKKDDDYAYTVMADLAKFCAKDSRLGLEDLESEVNWGMAPRDGKLVPVVIDAGLDC